MPWTTLAGWVDVPENRVQRIDVTTWEKMDLISPPGLKGIVPKRYINASFGAGGALTPLGLVTDGGSPKYVGTPSTDFLLDMDDTGIGVLAPHQDQEPPFDVSGGLSLLTYSGDHSSPFFESSVPLGGFQTPVNGHVAGLYEGVGFGNPTSAVVVDVEGNVYRGGGSIATVSGSTTTDATSSLAAGTYQAYAFGFINTLGGLFLVSVHRAADLAVSSGQGLELTLTWSDQPPNSVVYVYLRLGSRKNYINPPLIERLITPVLLRATPPAVEDTESVTGDAYLIGTGGDGSSFVVNYDPVGTVLPDRAFASVPTFFSRDDVPFGVLPAVAHRGRYYNVARTLARRGGEPGDTSAGALSAAQVGSSGRMVAYSDAGYVNFGSSLNWFVVPLRGTGATITGLLSSPAGLLIFSQQEIYLMTGDPAGSDFSLQLVSQGLGADTAYPSLRPRRMGGTALFVHEGRLMAYTLGMGDVDFGGGLANLTDELMDPAIRSLGKGKVQQFMPIPASNAVGAIIPDYTGGGSNLGKMVVYNLDTKYWTEMHVGVSEGTFMLYPLPSGGVVVMQSPLAPNFFDGGGIAPPVWGRYLDFIAPPPWADEVDVSVEYEQLSFGDRGQWKTWMYLEVQLSGLPESDSLGSMWARYNASPTDSEPLTGDILFEQYPPFSRNSAVLRAYFPSGLTSEVIDLEFHFGLKQAQSVRGWSIYAVPRSRER